LHLAAYYASTTAYYASTASYCASTKVGNNKKYGKMEKRMNQLQVIFLNYSNSGKWQYDDSALSGPIKKS
jgi:hypothetical protein